jgi:hypothetical protein
MGSRLRIHQTALAWGLPFVNRLLLVDTPDAASMLIIDSLQADVLIPLQASVGEFVKGEGSLVGSRVGLCVGSAVGRPEGFGEGASVVRDGIGTVFIIDPPPFPILSALFSDEESSSYG